MKEYDLLTVEIMDETGRKVIARDIAVEHERDAARLTLARNGHSFYITETPVMDLGDGEIIPLRDRVARTPERFVGADVIHRPRNIIRQFEKELLAIDPLDKGNVDDLVRKIEWYKRFPSDTSFIAVWQGYQPLIGGERVYNSKAELIWATDCPVSIAPAPVPDEPVSTGYRIYSKPLKIIAKKPIK